MTATLKPQTLPEAKARTETSKGLLTMTTQEGYVLPKWFVWLMSGLVPFVVYLVVAIHNLQTAVAVLDVRVQDVVGMEARIDIMGQRQAVLEQRITALEHRHRNDP